MTPAKDVLNQRDFTTTAVEHDANGRACGSACKVEAAWVVNIEEYFQHPKQVPKIGWHWCISRPRFRACPPRSHLTIQEQQQMPVHMATGVDVSVIDYEFHKQFLKFVRCVFAILRPNTQQTHTSCSSGTRGKFSYFWRPRAELQCKEVTNALAQQQQQQKRAW